MPAGVVGNAEVRIYTLNPLTGVATFVVDTSKVPSRIVTSSGSVAGAAIGGAGMFGLVKSNSSSAASWEEWTMPARFEGQGAVTLGCAFWDVPHLTAYGDDNPKLDYVNIVVGGDSGQVETFGSVDGPQGTAFLSGTRCAVSVDWNAFPTHARPAD